jgi:virginiamycin B lyase
MPKTKVRLMVPTKNMTQIGGAKDPMTLMIFLMLIFSLSLYIVRVQFVSAQQQLQQPTPSATDELVTYEKHSSFIREFPIPLEDRGLRGITTDSAGNAWFLHSTNKTSTIFKLEPEGGKFTQYPIKGDTVADDPVINLAAGQLVFDKERGAIWFTDARVNSIGKLDEVSGQIKLWQVPTQNAGPMGIVLSPDSKSLWFAEITGNKIARFDIQAEKIVEYSTGEGSGPALLSFDEKGQLWVSLSFSDSIMLTQIGNNLASNSSSIGMVNMSLPKPDRFSPLGVAISDGKVYLSDHGSSRVIVADENSGLQSYDVYWTSPSAYPTLPATLPGQVVVDKKSGNVYFPQHGGNRITEIRPQDGLMTEYDIPTGPLSTVLFLTTSDEGRIWFTEWASNKVAYLDTSMQVPFEQQVQQKSITLTKSNAASVNVLIKSAAAANASAANNNNNSSSNNSTSSLSLSQVEVGLTGMSESGPIGITYQANPPRVNLQGNSSSAAESTIQLKAEDNAKPGTYTAMVRVQAPEQQDGLIISRLYPIKLVLDVPQPTSVQTGPSASNSSQASTLFEVRDLIRALAIAAAVGLGGYIVYRRIKRKPIQS